MTKTISVCIPTFNEAANVRHAVEEVERVFARDLPGYGLEIVVTDNASTDATWSVVQSLAAERPHLKAFRFSRNFGYQNSVFAAIALSSGHAVVELDADLEDPPAVIPEFVRNWEDGHQVVYGVRTRRCGNPAKLFLFSAFYRLLNRLSDVHLPENAGDFRLLDRKVADLLAGLPERNLYLRGLTSYLGFSQKPVPYERDPRRSGPSKFRLLQYFVLAVDALTAFSKTPLRLIGRVGVLLFLLSAGLSAYYILGWFFGGVEVKGFTTLAVLSLGLHSVTFIFLGILGEYLSRIFDDAKHRPRVVIAEAVNAAGHPDSL